MLKKFVLLRCSDYYKTLQASYYDFSKTEDAQAVIDFVKSELKHPVQEVICDSIYTDQKGVGLSSLVSLDSCLQDGTCSQIF